MKILFVDDEPNIIQGLKRMLHSMRNEWEMFFVESGEAALKILASGNIDILVTDMRMPQMDGAQLLYIVKEKYPGVVRIILSGYSEKEFIMKTSSTAHQFLGKPCKVEALKSTIQRICNLRTLVCSDEVRKKVAGLSNLPSLPDIYKKLDDELNSTNVSIKRIGDIISKDLTMTAKILQMVNSAFFGLPQNINDPVQAANFLGMDTIKSLVLFHHLFSMFEKIESVQDYLKKMWDHSFKVATAAKKIYELKCIDHFLPEQAFVSGLLHDIGKLILVQIPEYRDKISELNTMSGRDLRIIEQSIFGTDHSMVGGYLLGLWGLPDYIVESAAFHHSPSAIGDEHFSILSAVHLSHINSEDDALDNDYLESIGVLDELEKYSEIVTNIGGLKGE
jgi:HD-like signal output (HDOD) protein